MSWNFIEKKFGKYAKRVDFTKITNNLKLPHLLEIQIKHYKDLVEKGIQNKFAEVLPISIKDDNIILSFDKIWFDKPKNCQEKSRLESKTYERPLNVRMNLSINSTKNIIDINPNLTEEENIHQHLENSFGQSLQLIQKSNSMYYFTAKSKNEVDLEITASIRGRKQENYVVGYSIIRRSDVFFGNFPLMTQRGTFIINGSEKVVISQMTRAPGAYFKKLLNLKTGGYNFFLDLIPARGTWLEFESIFKSADIRNEKDGENNVILLKIDKSRKLSITHFLSALGLTPKTVSYLFDNK